MITIGDKEREKIILLPGTIDYYQEELTRMLESERYREAEELLSFLLSCRIGDPLTSEEWAYLLEWLRTSFARDPGAMARDEDEDISERELHRLRIGAKAAQDPGYAERLLEILLGDFPPDRKALALEQLAVADHPQIDETIRRWLEQAELHPLFQFKALQVLSLRGAKGTVRLNRRGESVEVDISATPVDIGDFPGGMRAVLERIGAAAEAAQPNLIFFAEQTWKEFLSYIYGTSLYKRLSDPNRGEAEVWSAALHMAVLEAVSGKVDPAPLLERYGLDGDDLERFRQAYEAIKDYLGAVSPF